MKLRLCRVIATLLVCQPAMAQPSAVAADRPNIVVMLADDLGWRDLGCTGSPDHRTPNLDYEVGRLLDALEASGKSSNTLVIFTSDNGGHPEVSANGPLRGSKWNLYQGGLRMPLIARWPGRVPAGSTCADTVIGTDLAATLIEAAGPVPASAGVNDFAVSRTQPQAAIRSGKWKLIHNFESDRDELFDLDSDPSESHDLVDSDPGRAAALRDDLLTRLASSGARLPRSKP